jgi:hypothetical protein
MRKDFVDLIALEKNYKAHSHHRKHSAKAQHYRELRRGHFSLPRHRHIRRPLKRRSVLRVVTRRRSSDLRYPTKRHGVLETLESFRGQNTQPCTHSPTNTLRESRGRVSKQPLRKNVAILQPPRSHVPSRLCLCRLRSEPFSVHNGCLNRDAGLTISIKERFVRN